jgi:hypothetical protein
MIDFRFILQLSAKANFKAYSTAFLLITGSTPGSPVQIGQICVLGGLPNLVEQEQNILVLVLSWA